LRLWPLWSLSPWLERLSWWSQSFSSAPEEVPSLLLAGWTGEPAQVAAQARVRPPVPELVPVFVLGPVSEFVPVLVLGPVSEFVPVLVLGPVPEFVPVLALGPALALAPALKPAAVAAKVSIPEASAVPVSLLRSSPAFDAS
jgi:hypothetical protein